MGDVRRTIDPASPIWITPTVLGSCLALFGGYALYTYKKPLPLPPLLNGAAQGHESRAAAASEDNKFYFFFDKVPNLDIYNIPKIVGHLFGSTPVDSSDMTVRKNFGIFIILLLTFGLTICEITVITSHIMDRKLESTSNVGVQVASALTLSILLAVLFYRLRDTSMTPMLYLLSLSFIMILGALISSQVQVNAS